MTVLFAEYGLTGTLLTSIMVMLAAFAYLQHGNAGLLRCVRWALGLIAVLLSVSAWGLLKALMDDNFTLAYVVEHSERALGAGYKAAAFWAGQEGSLLFWAWVLGMMGVVMAFRARKRNDKETAISLAVMAGVTGFFAAVMLFAGNPFARATELATDGRGLNPLLQNLAMVIHPPMLFLGYAGYAAPFALLMGALFTGNKDSEWVKEARGWMIYSWIMLTVGIVLGAQWAYVELAFGGFWAWDPVENASLLPWLTGTALLHAAVLQTKRGVFKRWTASLVAASFFLCILGTYLTRSGVVQSMHGFETSPIGTFFLVFLGMIAAVSVLMILVRLPMLKAEREISGLMSREGLFLVGIVVLVIMCVVTLVGTTFPIFSRAFGTQITIGAVFYNNVILPMGLVLGTAMAVGLVIGSGADAAVKARTKLAGMAMFAAGAALVVYVMGYVSPWAMAAAAVVAAIVAGVAIDLIVTLKNAARGGAAVLIKTFAGRPRHWGAQVAHLGLASLILGVMGMGVYAVKQNATLTADGKTARVGGYTLKLVSLEQVQRENHAAVVATLDVTDGAGRQFELKPETRFYPQNPEQSNSKVGIHFGLGQDMYINLAGWADDGKVVTVIAYINPLVNWIWIGGALLTLGGLLCLVPFSRRAPVVVAETSAAPSRLTTGKTARDRRRARVLDATYVTERR